MAHTDLHAATEKKVRDARLENKAPTQSPAKTYPTSIAKPTTPDETQTLGEDPKFTTWYKGWLTRSRIYERKLPGEQEVSALTLEGPGDSFMSLRHDGSIRLVTGVKDPNRGPGSGKLAIKTYGQQQEHMNRSDLEFNAGDDEDGDALTVLCYGNYVENVKGASRYLYATKIILSATSELVLEGGSIKIQSESDLLMSGTSITTGTTNKKDIVTGQNKSQGSGENTTEQLDPRATTVWSTPGSIKWNVAQDFKQDVGGCYEVYALGGAGTMIKNRLCGMSLSTLTSFAAGGTKGVSVTSKGPLDITATATTQNATTLVTTASGAMTVTSADLTVTAAEVSAEVASLTVTSAGDVRITGTLIYLN